MEPITQNSPGSTAVVNRFVIFAIVAGMICVAYWHFADTKSLQWLADRETQLRQFQVQYPALLYVAAFLLYVFVTGLSLPGAAAMSLVCGWFFGMLPALVLVSFASTAGATLAFLLSRFLWRDALQRRFATRLASFNESLQRDGPFFLFTLRLIPVVPFFVVNAVMGLTSIKTRTFWWVSQLGMLAGTVVYVYAGSSVPALQAIADEGVNAVFTSSQMFRIVAAFTLLGFFPLIVRCALQTPKTA